jgi:hypothetical protein
VLAYYNKNFIKSLMHVFPEIGLVEDKLKRKVKIWSLASHFYILGKFWQDIKNQQDVFIEFAQHHGFSAFSAEGWYNINPDAFHSSKVVSFIVLQLV